MLIRPDTAQDAPAIRDLVTSAMLLLPQSIGTEADIIERLRVAGALTLSLVAEDQGVVVGYIAVSEARIGGEDGWGLIGPLAVLPARHREGIGSALMAEALAQLKPTHKGAALVGDPGYYHRFGFQSYAGLSVGDCPPEFIQALPFDAAAPRGEILHHAAFGLSQQG